MTDSAPQPRNPERLDNEQLTALQPGLARIMPEVGDRFWKAYYAAEARNWPFAAWQLRELRKLLKLCEITRPKYTEDLEAYIVEDIEPLLEAIADQDFERFRRLYGAAVEFANELHRRWDKPWILWKLPDFPPPDLDLTPIP